MDRHYLYAGTHRVHYYRGGEGAPLVVLPTFPGGARLVAELALWVGSDATVLALDLPGTGESSALPGAATAEDYAGWLSEVLDALDLPVVDLVAFGTSAPVASVFSRLAADRLRRLVLISPPVLTQAERVGLLASGCPPLIPDAEGSHVTRQWGQLRDSYMFVPWFDRRLEARVYRDLPSANRLYDEFVDLMRAAPEAREAVHLGWTHDWQADLTGSTEVSILVQEGDAVRFAEQKITPRLLKAPDDFEGIAAHLRSAPSQRALLDAPPAPRVVSVPGEVRRSYVKTSVGQVLVRRIEGAEPGGTPLVLFHGSLWSSANLEPKLHAYSARRPVLTLDVPGVGDSAPVGGEPEMVDIARIVVEALDLLESGTVDLQGGHSGAMIAMDVAILRPDSVRRVILDGVTMFSDAQLAEMLPHYLLPLRVSDDGAFLNWAWQFLRDMFLWYPWYDHRGSKARSDGRVLDPLAQHAYFTDFLKGGRSFVDYYRAALTYRTQERAPLLRAQTLYCCSAKDTLREETIAASALSPGSIFRFTPGRASPEAIAATEAVYLSFLDNETPAIEQAIDW